MPIYPLEQGDLPKLIERFHGPPVEGPEYAMTYYEEVAYEIGRCGDDGIQFLWRQIDDADSDRLPGLVVAISTFDTKKKQRVCDMLIDHLDADDELVAIYRLRPPG